jgi:RimJ/RimL family protein N-acetyltransferase
MSRSLRIPGLIDLVRADTRSDIRGLANDSRLDRRFEARGPLINRILVERIRNVLRIDGVPLPSVAPRQDAERVRTQDTLRRRLDPSGATPLWDDETIAGLVGVVRGRGGSELGPATQQAVGRLFVADYRGTGESWEAAKVLDDAVHTRNPLRAIVLQLSGRLQRSRRLLADLVNNDLAGVHATGIAVHNLVRGFERMRELWSDPRWRLRSADAVVEQCMFAPPSVLRQATMPGATVAGAVRPGTLVVLELDVARAHTPGRDVELMTGTWAQCPAAAFVPALLRVVWERAVAAPATGKAS